MRISRVLLPYRLCLRAGLVLLTALAIGPAALAQTRDGVPVVVAPALVAPVYREVQVTGTVTSARSARLSAATSGLVQEIDIDEGSRVAAGDVLLRLDSELARLQLQSAEARVAQAEHALGDAQRRLREARELAPLRSIAESVVRDLAAEVEEDGAALREMQAEAGFRRALVQRHAVVAPFDGVVSVRLTELGEWVIPGQPVLELVSTGQLRLDFAVSENHVAAIEPGAAVSYFLASGAENARQGRVAAVVPVADPEDRTFLLRVLPDAEDPALVPGRSVRASLQLSDSGRGVVVSRDAVLRYPDGRAVIWVVEQSPEGEVAQERVVQVGIQFQGQFEITEGLEEGARVVVQGNEALRPGQRVRIVPAAGR